MGELPFSVDFIQFLVDNRTLFLTRFFQFASFMGAVEGYVLVITLIYVAYDKTLAFRLTALVLVTMSLNHFLKILIKNPRPFITEGTYPQKWAVSAQNAQELATEYSTPSGHAMSAASFYSLLYANVKRIDVRIIAVLAIILIGLSRPYLAVHYLEDVVAGWLLGVLFVLVLLRYAQPLGRLWNARSYTQQIVIVVVSSIMMWVLTLAVNGGGIHEQPLAFLAYSGFLTGIVIAHPLELDRVNFDPRSSTVLRKAVRFLLTIALVLASLLLFDELFGKFSDDVSPLGHLLHYIRYAIAGTVGMFFAPLLFTKLRLAEACPRAPLDAAVPDR